MEGLPAVHLGVQGMEHPAAAMATRTASPCSIDTEITAAFMRPHTQGSFLANMRESHEHQLDRIFFSAKGFSCVTVCFLEEVWLCQISLLCSVSGREI